jgi:hypothetical protein
MALSSRIFWNAAQFSAKIDRSRGRIALCRRNLLGQHIGRRHAGRAIHIEVRYQPNRIQAVGRVTVSERKSMDTGISFAPISYQFNF